MSNVKPMAVRIREFMDSNPTADNQTIAAALGCKKSAVYQERHNRRKYGNTRQLDATPAETQQSSVNTGKIEELQKQYDQLRLENAQLRRRTDLLRSILDL